MVVVNPEQEHGVDGHEQGEAQLISDNCDDELQQRELDIVFAEQDPHKQFELFASCVGMPGVECMTTSTRLLIEYDYLNVMFCREQNFTTDQIIAFRGIARKVFEASIVRGELDLDGAFQDFTEQVISLAVLPDLNEQRPGRATPPGDNLVGTSKGVGELTMSTTAKDKTDPLPSRERRTSSGAKVSAEVERNGGVDLHEGGNARAGPVFSVSDVKAITQFVAHGLYRNFTLYRTCFAQEARCCREIRSVQVETPLVPTPLSRGKLLEGLSPLANEV